MEKVTVIILSYQREDTLVHTLESCAAVQDPEVEFLVSDDCSTDGSAAVAKAFARRDRRFTFMQPPCRLGMAEHYEFAISRVTGGYLLILGCDDAIKADAVTRLRNLITAHPGIRAFQGFLDCYYYPSIATEDRETLHFTRAKSETVSETREWLECLAGGRCNIGRLPVPYQRAFVHVSVFEEIKRRAGRVVGSLYPDFFLGIAVAAVLEKWVRVEPGFVVSGLSIGSTGFSQLSPHAARDMEKRFLDCAKLEQHPLVPYIRSAHILIGECLLRAREAGLLPADVVIDWGQLIGRAWFEFMRQDWSEKERGESLDALTRLAANMNCEHVITGAREHADPRAWWRQFGRERDGDEDSPPVVFSTRDSGINGVHEAAAALHDLTRLLDGGADQSDAARRAETRNMVLLRWALRESLERIGEIKGETWRLAAESERRAAARDKARQQAARTKEKLEKLCFEKARQRRRILWFEW